LQATIDAMAGCGAHAADCVAVIGPAICGRCYEVPAEMRDEVASHVPGSAAMSSNGTPSLDLAAGAERILRDAGIGNVSPTGICTKEDERFFSYRRDRVTGRFAGVVMLESRD
jgi:copper oxidase (laccase) domain-containing protein